MLIIANATQSALCTAFFDATMPKAPTTAKVPETQKTALSPFIIRHLLLLL
jgi:hypothetical protein